MNPRCGLVKAGESKLTEEEDISKGEEAVGGGGGTAREDTQLEEGDVIKTKHISFHSSSCPTPARLAITFPSAFLAFFFLNWVHPN